MAVDRISAVAQALPLQARGAGGRQRVPAAGETMHLTYAETVGDDLLVATSDGRTLRLTGLAAVGQELTDGDVLLVRVLRNSPDLELELFGSVSRQGRPAMTPMSAEQAAMRFDQAALRQISWRSPDPAVLATSWRALVHGQWRGEALHETPAGLGAGAYLPFVSDPVREMTSGGCAPVERWAFPVYAWGGLPMMLRLVGADPDEARATPRLRTRAMALRLDLTLPGMGRVTVQVQWISGGIQLSLAAEDANALEYLRERLPEMATALARCGLQLLRCRLNQGLPGLEANTLPALPQGPAAAVPPGLFRAAAEVIVLLVGSSQVAISPASR